MSKSIASLLVASVTVLTILLTACSDDPTPTPTSTPSPEPTATWTPAPTAVPTPTEVEVDSYIRDCEGVTASLATVFGSEEAADLDEGEEITWGELAELSQAMAVAYGQLIPPTEIQALHDANLRIIEALGDRAIDRPSEDLFSEEFANFLLEFTTAIFGLAFDTSQTDEEKEQQLEDLTLKLISGFFGPDFIPAIQAVEEARAGIAEETLALLDESECSFITISPEGEEAGDSFKEPETSLGTFSVGENVRVGDYLVEMTDAYLVEDESRVSLAVTIQNAGHSPVPMPDWDTLMSLQDQDGYPYDRSRGYRNTASDLLSPDSTVNYSLTYSDVSETRGLTWKFSDGETGATFDLTGVASLQALLEMEREALVALYNATDGPNWANSDGWLSDAPIGTWYGVSPDSNGRVTRLLLGENRLSGEIPSELGSLSNLRYLDLGSNQLKGVLPPELGSLSNLEHLIIVGNQLSGEIPEELGTLTNLQSLSLAGNQLSGEIPEELGTLTNLVRLHLSENQLSGAIPAELGNLPNLAWLYLSSNLLSGRIPPELGHLANLRDLALRNNQLGVCIPVALQDVGRNDLHWLDLPYCGDEADAPTQAAYRAALVALYNATDGLNWENNGNWLSDAPIGKWYGVTTDINGYVTGLDLRNNQLNGTVPTELGSLTKLTALDLGWNQLSGDIPLELGSLSELQVLRLNKNQLGGDILLELSALPDLRELALYDNHLSGAIPPELGALSNLQVLRLDDNELRGEIPSSLEALSNLYWLDLSRNQLSGCIPAGLRSVRSNDLEDVGLPYCDAAGATDSTPKSTPTPVPTPAPTPSPTPVSTPLSLGEYLLNCSTPKVMGMDLEDDFTYGDFSVTITESLAAMSPLTPPAEVADWHSKAMAYLQTIKTQVDRQPGDDVVELAVLVAMALTIGGLEEIVEDENAMPGEVRRRMAAAGCLEDLGRDADRAVLVALYTATDGPNWTNNTGWLSDAPIGEWYGAITDLRGRVTLLGLEGNELSGEIPAELGSLSYLEELQLSFNDLSGEIPVALGSLANLRGLGLAGNQLRGEIPGQIGSLSNLEWLGLDGNQLSGRIPLELGGLSNLRALRLDGNRLSGEIPGQITSLSNLDRLWLAGNHLSGCVPAGLRDVPDNDLGDLGLPYCGESAGRVESPDRATLVALYESTDGPNWKDNHNWLSKAPISEWFGVNTDDNGRVVGLDLVFNQLNGSIPPELSNLANLRELVLRHNQLSGEIPPEIGNLSKLEYLFLDNNQLSGEIPADLGRLSNLLELFLYSNQLSGEIPPALGNLSNLERLLLDTNQLSGEIPSALGNLSNLEYLYLENNQLNGEIPAEMGSLSNLIGLNLNENQLDGEIPAELGNLANLQQLFLSGNQLSGCIPAGLRDVEDNDLDELGLPYCGESAGRTESPDRAALVALYNATDGPNWTNNTNWLSDAHIGRWHGVRIINGSIFLNLERNQLKGEIPPELGDLTNLRGLHLSGNQLSGCIPAELREVSTNDLNKFGLPDCDATLAPPVEPMLLSTTLSQDGHGCGLRPDGTAVCWGGYGSGQLSPPAGETFTIISTGQVHSCGLRPDGTPVCWGVEWESPPADEKLSAISAGNDHTCGLRQDGTAVCWGTYGNGQASPPVGERFKSISAGSSHTCGLRTDGVALCWGNDASGQASPPGGETFTSISAGGGHTCGLHSDGTAVCWGPHPSPPTDWKFSSISSGGDHTCGLRLDGSAVCWGWTASEQLFPPANERFTSISAGLRHTCGLRSDDSVLCWGWGKESGTAPRTHPPANERFTSISSGNGYSCGLLLDGSPVCWGWDGDDGRTTPPEREKFAYITTGERHTCGLRSDGTAVCWGSNRYGQSSPPAYERLTAISAGWNHTCGLRSDGTAVCWGWNFHGQSSPPADETFTIISAGQAHSCGLRPDGTPVCWGVEWESPPVNETFVSISSSFNHTCGLRSDGSVECWGDDRHVGEPPPAHESFAAISGACGLRSDGSLVCWGFDFGGRASPPANERFVAISGTCGLRPDGTAVCWGAGASPPTGERFMVSPAPIAPAGDVVVSADQGPQIYNDNVFILPVTEDIAATELPLWDYAARFYERFDDEFDFLVFVSNVSHIESSGNNFYCQMCRTTWRASVRESTHTVSRGGLQVRTSGRGAISRRLPASLRVRRCTS